MNCKKIICAALTVAMLPFGGICYGYTAKAADPATVVRLDPSKDSPFNDGRFEGWGTSMGWWGNRIGHSDKMSQQAAHDLYSEEGLGLDIVRYNVGGGDNPTHNHISRSDSKLPCFAVPEYEGGAYQAETDGENVKVTNLKTDENGDVIYDWNWDADKDQINVLKRIKTENPEVHIEGYTNSPPWFITISQCSGGGVSAGDENLAPENYDVFAKFLADVTKHMEEIGLPFDSYSPMNEPNPRTKYWTALNGKQEGNLVAVGEHQSGLIKALKDEYTKRGITTLVAGPDETNIDYSISSVNALTDDAKAALDRIDTHTYGGSKRAELKQTAINAGKNLWMSEVDKGENGFWLAQRIIDDLNGMQASAWVMWDIIDMHKDSSFVDPTTGNKTEANNSLNPTGGLWGVGMGNHDTETVEWANKYYAFGQFTRYINPGDTLIASSNKTLAAYNKDTGDIKIVVTNSGGSDIPYEFDLSAFKTIGDTVEEIRSNNATGTAAEHWAAITDGAALVDKKLTTTAKAGTITTYIIKGTGEAQYAVINGGDGELLIGDTIDMTLDTNIAGAPQWSVDGNGVAEITQEGKLTINKSGTVTVTAVIDGLTATKPITVPLNIIGGGNQLTVGDRIQLSCNVVPNYGGTVTWAVDNAEAAEITQDGLLSVKSSGTITVSLTVAGVTATKTFEVPAYALSGTPSWSDASNAPKDSDDYRKAADGDLNTYFDGNQNGYVMYDYGTPYKISRVRLAARSGNGMADRTKGGKVQGSNDAIAWTDLYTISEAIPAGQYTDVTTFASDKAYRYYRYTNPDTMTNIAEFLIEGEPSADVPTDDPTVKDISEFTDNFEGGEYMFKDAAVSGLADGNIVYASGLERFGNVFIPANSTAGAALDEAVTLGNNQLFRLRFNMFAGWESGGKDNTFAIKDSEGNEVVSFTVNVGSSSLTSFKLNGENVLNGTPNVQCKSNPTASKSSATGWNNASQPYRNNMGYNKTVEILIEGAGKVSAAFNGGNGDISVSGVLTAPVNIKSLELKGACGSARDRIVSYDNFDADLITYKDDFITSTPAPEPTATPEPGDKPEIPDDGTLISLNFDNGDLTSGSPYGKATAVKTAKFATVDDRKVLQLDNTNNTVVKLTDANGGGLLAGQDEVTISFAVKPTTNNAASWWFFSAPNDNEQKYKEEHYIGALLSKDDNGQFKFERYNGGERAKSAIGPFTLNQWNDIIISISKDKTELYVNGELADSVDSSFKLSDILGTDPIAYIGRANWGTNGEFATGYIDDFVIKQGAYKTVLGGIDLGDTSAVKSDIEIPEIEGVTWESSNPDVVSTNGKVTRRDDTVTVTLTARNGDDTRQFEVTVVGLTAFADTFTAYAEGSTIKFTSDEETDSPYTNIVALHNEDGSLVSVKTGEYTGSFDNVADGTYKVSLLLWSGLDSENAMVPKHNKVTRTVVVKPEIETAAYLFAHFVGNESSADHEQIYFSVSTDGTTWETLNSGKPVLKSGVGEKGVRDPYILRGEGDKFFIIATDLSIYNLGLTQGSNKWGYSQTNGSKNIVVWESDDLVNWSDANLVKVAVDNAGCTWAPEAVYDKEKRQYMVFWASKVAGDNYSKQRVYRSYTGDFKTFTAPEVYIETDAHNIDTTIVEEKGVYYRFTKDESKKSVTMMRSISLDGPWTDVETYTINGTAGNNVTGYEGPTIYKNGNGGWTLLLDHYSKGDGYKPFVTNDLSKGVFTSGSAFTFDATYRHGTVMPITQEEYNSLIQKYSGN